MHGRLEKFPHNDLILGLTPREAEVFLLLGYGMSNRTMSALLGVTERTVKYHITQILAKLGLESRLQVGLASYQYRQVHIDDFLQSGAAPVGEAGPAHRDSESGTRRGPG